MRYSVLMLVCLSFLVVGCSSQPNMLMEQEKKDGWILLFDGHSTDGWHSYRKLTATNWKVINGSLVRVSAGGDLMTNKQYDNFVLELDWKIPPKGNSGVLYRADENEDKTWYTGPEVQILDDSGKPVDKHSSAACYDLYAPTQDVRKSPGTWNHFTIVCDGPNITHFMNGQQVCSYKIGSDDWNQRVEHSKFFTHPRFGRLRSGEIALQDHNAAVEFRNIKLKPLP